MKHWLGAFLVATTLLMQTAASAACNGAKDPHHFTAGAVVLWMNARVDVEDIRIEGDRLFGGVQLRYEYIKPWRPYFGAELVVTGTGDNFDAFLGDVPVEQDKEELGFGNLEFRLGYTLRCCSALFSPYVGLGVYHIGTASRHHQNFEDSLPYFVGGVRSKLFCFLGGRVGVNAKAFHTVDAEQEFTPLCGDKRTTHHDDWGFEVGVPISWYLGCRQRVALEIEPYYLNLNVSERLDVVGGRVSLIIRV